MKKYLLAIFCTGLIELSIVSCGKEDVDDNGKENKDNVTDADGNVYSTVTIGTQTWMVENLKTTKYNDGTAIPYVTEWTDLTTGAYCWYNNDEATYKNKYGSLYNWHAVNTGKLAPKGWHIPTKTEWQTLVNYVSTHLGNSPNLVKALAARTDWTSSTDAGAIGNDLSKNNSSGFSALPGGLLGSWGFLDINEEGFWWTSTEVDADYAHSKFLFNTNNGYTFTTNEMGEDEDGKSILYSVRCLKD